MMKKYLLFCTVALFVLLSGFDNGKPAASTEKVAAVLDDYERYKEPVIKDRFFKHGDILPLIEKHSGTGLFKREVLGHSVQGRSINHLTLGRGKTKVLMWSQMHGDESTATMALFDLFNFFAASDEHNDLRKYLLDNLELHFVPMLNPDGAEMWKRRNALDIDINRDARAQVTPEGRILLKLAKDLRPDFGFNLHDQSMYYNAGPTDKTATISFLAPAFNYEKDMNDVRKRATQVIVGMNSMLQKQIPGRVAKYNDDFEPRAFGDNIQRLGVSTILIESGGYPGDPEKQYIRKLNFHALLNAFEAIARQTFGSEDIKAYDEIPENHRSLYDLVIRNVETEIGGQPIRTNLCINRGQLKSGDYRSVSYRGSIEEVGDLERVFGYEEVDDASLKTVQPKTKIMTKKEWNALSPQAELNLIKQGFLFVKWSDGKSPAGAMKNRLLNLTNNAGHQAKIGLGQYANFILSKDGMPVFAVVNGFLVNLSEDAKPVLNTMGY